MISSKWLLLILLFSGCFEQPVEEIKIDPVDNYENISQYEVDESFKSEAFFNRQPRGIKYWDYPPDIVLCPGPKISQARFKRAIKYWENLGYTFGNITTITEIHGCSLEPSTGEIMISLFSGEIPIGSNLAVTQVHFYTATSEILSSRISMLPAHSNKPWILEHEIGHALGWDHFNQTGHIMNPEYDRLGSNSRGVNFISYIAISDEIKSRTEK